MAVVLAELDSRFHSLWYYYRYRWRDTQQEITVRPKGGARVYMTQEADYAVRIVYCLAESAERRDARFVSDKIGVPLRFSLKILRKLVASGLLKSYKGQRGGYELARAPEDITLNDVIETVDGPYVINRCLRDGHECSGDNSADCHFRAIYADVSNDIKTKLSGVSFRGLMER